MNKKSQAQNFHVGDTVYICQLKGTVTDVCIEDYFPVKVSFGNTHKSFTMSGAQIIGSPISLSHTPYTCRETKKGLLLEGFSLTKERYIKGEYYWFSDWKTQWVHKEYVRTVGVEKENVANYVAINSVNNNGETTHRVYRYMQKNKP
jgi:hypothetical protein